MTLRTRELKLKNKKQNKTKNRKSVDFTNSYRSCPSKIRQSLQNACLGQAGHNNDLTGPN